MKLLGAIHYIFLFIPAVHSSDISTSSIVLVGESMLLFILCPLGSPIMIHSKLQQMTDSQTWLEVMLCHSLVY